MLLGKRGYSKVNKKTRLVRFKVRNKTGAYSKSFHDLSSSLRGRKPLGNFLPPPKMFEITLSLLMLYFSAVSSEQHKTRTNVD